MANIAFYGSHNAAVAVEEDGKLLQVIEVERFIGQKNAGYGQYLTSYSRPFMIKHILEYIEDQFGIKEYDTCYYMNTDTFESHGKVLYEQFIPANNYVSCLHHKSHAACGLYQTDYDQALIVSFDGGGNDGFFNIYHASNRNTIELVEKFGIDLGFPYMSFGDFLDDIRKEPALNIGNLVYSGKIMGLCSYGNVNEDWLPHFIEYYKKVPEGPTYMEMLDILSEKIGVKLDMSNRLKGQTAWDVAMTSQRAFEEVFLEYLDPFLKQYPDLPLIVVGGCALNIILNSRLERELDRDVFIPPNPNDCGLATGMILDHIKPENKIDVTYAGIPILDKATLMTHVEEKRGVEYTNEDIVKNLSEGKIIGVVRDTAEHGPRALGNRSIICDPTFENMKDILNEKVKNREWYRPFAPVCRLEDVSKYFEFGSNHNISNTPDSLTSDLIELAKKAKDSGQQEIYENLLNSIEIASQNTVVKEVNSEIKESRWMSFCPKVREEWRDKLVSITHVDGTARVQTVTKEQNEWLYDLLTDFEKKTGCGVLLNTSFNVNGKPILSRYSEALKVYDNTEMDALILQDYYFKKFR